MRLLRKIVFTIALLFLLTVISLSTFAWLRQDQLTSAFVSKINETINTKISYGDLRVTIFESFPSITVRFKDLLITPSPFYDRSQFENEDHDTLLFASSLSLSAGLPSLLTGTIAIRSIYVKEGKLNMLRDKRGDINYEVFTGDSKGGRNVRLNSIILKQINTVWSDRGSELKVSGTINELSLDGQIFNTGIFINSALDASLASFEFNGMSFSGIPAKASVRVRKSGSSVSIAKGSLDLGGFSFLADGMVNYSASTLDLTIEGRKIDVAALVAGLPQKWKSITGGFNPSGIIDIKCSLTGAYGEAGSPHIDLSYSLSNGRMSHISSGLNVNNLSFKGIMTSGKLDKPETFLFTIDTLYATYGSASLAATFRLTDLVKPHIFISIAGDINFDDLRKVLGTDFVRNQTGSVRGSFMASGAVPSNLKMLIASLPALNPKASVTFNDFGATFASSGMTFTGVTGSLNIDGTLTASDLSFAYMNQRFTVNAEMTNFAGWIAGKIAPMQVTGNVSADRLVTTTFTDYKSDSNSGKNHPLSLFPPDITMKIRVQADSLIGRKFKARNFTGMVDYKPYVITLSEVRAESLEGVLNGDLMLGKQKNGTYISKARLEVSDVDINKAFSTFNNFGQTFITSDNLSGRLKGNVTIMSPLDTAYKIETEALVAETHLSITNGRLVNFAPAESLSAFLDLDELKDISFSGMENDVYIRNRNVSIPKMLINSSAGNFTIYGTHSFMGDYTYHVRVLLSEVMSRKARERNRDVTAFGQVKVDGAGKATVPLKIVYVDGETDVGYDFGQAQENVKEDFAVEKQTLKGILNEEYGWYKEDTTKRTISESKPKFTITWEEGKEQNAETKETETEVRESPLKLLKKKKK